MRIGLLTGTALLACVAPAQSEGLPFSGAYGDEPGCAFHRDGTITTDNLIVIVDDRIRRFETLCPIVSVSSQAGGWLLSAECSGEGETWRQDYQLQPEKGGGFTISIPEFGYEAVIGECG